MIEKASKTPVYGWQVTVYEDDRTYMRLRGRMLVLWAYCRK